MTLNLSMNRVWEVLDELEPRQRIALAVGIPLALAVAYWFFVVNPRLLRASGQRFLVDELLEERNRKVSETARLNERKRQVDDLDTQLRLAVALGHARAVTPHASPTVRISRQPRQDL